MVRLGLAGFKSELVRQRLTSEVSDDYYLCVMKSVLTTLFLLCFFTVSSFAQPYDIRKVRWGMTKAQVQKIEASNRVVKRKVNELEYEVTLGRFPARLSYIFNKKNQLAQAAYWFETAHSEPQLYVEDYDEINKILYEKYGDPIEKQYNWANRLFEKNREKYGLAVSAGHLSIIHAWPHYKERMTVGHSLGGDNYHILHSIIYLSSLHEQPEKSNADF